MDEKNPHIILVKSVAALTKALGLTVVAEGIETIEVMENYHQPGVEFGQGYLLSRPLNLSDTKLWMAPYFQTDAKSASLPLLRVS